MTREQYAEMLRDISETHRNGGDVAACIQRCRQKYKYVYVYNDSCFKKIFGAEKNKNMTACFLNAILKLDGPDCISALDFINPSVPGGPFVKSVTSDIVALGPDKRRVVVEVQHKGGSAFKDKLVVYMACHTLENRVPGSSYKLHGMDFIALQMFDTFPDSPKYRHSIQLRNQDGEAFYGKEILTIVEVGKFLKDEGRYMQDDCRLALWLRAIEAVNDEKDSLDGNPYFTDLQSAAKLCNFDMEYLLTEAKFMTDRAYEMEIEREEAREEGLAEGRAEGWEDGLRTRNRELAKGFRDAGVSLDIIAGQTGLTEAEILAL